jgi:hypothetical protein
VELAATMAVVATDIASKKEQIHLGRRRRILKEALVRQLAVVVA